METFADRLIKSTQEKGSVLCVGIDPRIELLPSPIIDAAQEEFGRTFEGAISALRRYCINLVDTVAPLVGVVKLQAAFFERFGPKGMAVLWEVAHHAAGKGLIVIGDVKRGDIGTTAAAYADAYLGTTELFGLSKRMWSFDAITVNPFFGTDGVGPFVDVALDQNRGVFILVKTTNPSGKEIQDLVADGKEVFCHIAELVKTWAEEITGKSGYYSVGVVVGATHPDDLKKVRKLLPKTLFLIPGLGVQGGAVSDIIPAFDKEGKGAIVAASRSVDFAYLKEPYKSRYGQDNWTEAVKASIIKINKELNSAIGRQSPY